MVSHINMKVDEKRLHLLSFFSHTIAFLMPIPLSISYRPLSKRSDLPSHDARVERGADYVPMRMTDWSVRCHFDHNMERRGDGNEGVWMCVSHYHFGRQAEKRDGVALPAIGI